MLDDAYLEQTCRRCGDVELLSIEGLCGVCVEELEEQADYARGRLSYRPETREDNPREKGDDDGVEYADPRDYLEELREDLYDYDFREDF